jgi:mannobiose 2-epimerase
MKKQSLSFPPCSPCLRGATFFFAVTGVFGVFVAAAGQTPATDRPRYAAEAEENLQQHVLKPWFPRSVDKARGGFLQDFAEDWSPRRDAGRSLVYQSRLIWVASQAALRFPKEAEAYLGYARHGLEYLDKTMWDAESGGFFWELGPDGRPVRGGEKHTYGIAFAIYAAASGYAATHDERWLKLAQRGFTWLDEHAHDAKHGGYYEALTRAGQPILTRPTGPGAAATDMIGTVYGRKSQNSHIHVLEALTALYGVWPDAVVRARLEEVFKLVRDRLTAEPGYLHLFFAPDWTPVPDNDSYGHDVEAGYLLVEAAAALGHPRDERTWGIARKLVDHALDHGWDKAHGGFYDSGPLEKPATNTQKIWWVQAEGLNALLLMHEKYGGETDRYWKAYERQWEFIKTKQVDARHGGWYSSVRADGTATPGRVKSDRWTECYHQGRALLNVSATLRRPFGENTHREPAQH